MRGRRASYTDWSLSDSQNRSLVRTHWDNLLMALSVGDGTRLADVLGSGGVFRPIRFGVVGIVTFGVQMGVFGSLDIAGLSAVVANAIALAAAVQFNFAANQLFVWADKPVALVSRAFVQRWAAFHGCIAVSLVVNFGVFLVAQLFLPAVVAVVIGICSSTAIKFVSLDRFAFRPSPGA
jgi:putative flippase GtrA